MLDGVGRRSFLKQVGIGFGTFAVGNVRPFRASGQDGLESYTGYIVVALSPTPFERLATDVDDLRQLAAQANATRLSQVLGQYPDTPIARVITSVDARQVVELERAATRDGDAPLRSLTLYWRLDVRRVRDPTRLVELLTKTPGIDTAYRERRGSDPAVDAATDPASVEQRYLDAAPAGIGARWAWTQPNGDGSGVGFVDIEQGWLLAVDGASGAIQHEDLPRPRLSAGIPRTMSPFTCSAASSATSATGRSRHHGGAVIGIVAGMDNTTGVVGVAPNVSWIDVGSHYPGGAGSDVANVIMAVLPSMSAGDVLLVEWQDPMNRPAETDPLALGAIRAAVARGIVVIEPAGNMNIDLDAAVPQLSASNRQSGAILVGASTRNLPGGEGHDRWVMQASDFVLARPIPPFLPDCGYDRVPPVLPGSNFGARVDCHAWGEHVVSAGYGWLSGTSVKSSYTDRFGGTSAAAAIVAGAAIVLQGMFKAARGVALTPAELRNVFRTQGTPQGTGRRGHIGVMPDLKKAAAALQLGP